MPAHQATCVAIGDRGVLIEGAPGSGKSSLALALIDRGAMLLGDDGILLECQNGTLIARPHPNISGLIEVRNLGLLSFSVRDEVRVALVVRLDPDAPRYPDPGEICERVDVVLPLVRLTPHEAALAIKVELVLARIAIG